MWCFEEEDGLFEIRKINRILGNVYGVMLMWQVITGFAEALYRTASALKAVHCSEKWFEGSSNKIKFLP